MQRSHSYPAPGRRSPGPPVRWYRKPDVPLDHALPARTADRTRRIRETFVALGDGLTIQDIGNACFDRGLLDRFSTHRGALEGLLRALRPIASPDYWLSAQHRDALTQPSPARAPADQPG